MKLLSSDYDGTFNTGFSTDIRINMDYVKKFMEKGNIFLLNTGRPYESIMEEIKYYDIDYNYLSCSDGLLLLDNKDNIVYRSVLPESLYMELNFLNKDFGYHLNSQLYKFEYSNRLLEIMIVLERIDNNYLSRLNSILDRYNISYEKIERYGLIYLFVRERNYSKATSIRRLSILNKINKDNIFSVGDTWNDIPMLEEYNGYSMLNGSSDLLNYPKVDSVHELIKKIM